MHKYYKQFKQKNNIILQKNTKIWDFQNVMPVHEPSAENGLKKKTFQNELALHSKGSVVNVYYNLILNFLLC